MLANLFARRMHQSLPFAITKFNKCFGNELIPRRKSTSSTTSQNSETDETLRDKPIKFFGSEASEWRARDSRSGGADKVLWYQPYVISGSLAVFLIYFCILREESDIDRKLEGNLFDQVQGLEEVQLTLNYKYNKENGLDTRAIEKRLTELGVDVKSIPMS